MTVACIDSSLHRWLCSDTGLGVTAPDVKENVHTLKLTFDDRARVISRHRGDTLQLSGATAWTL